MLTSGLVSVAAVAVGTAVYFDARRLGMRDGGLSGDKPQVGPAGWALGCVIFPIAYVPAYVVRRQSFIRELGELRRLS